MTKQQKRTRSLIYCALFTILITVGAFIRIPLPNADTFTLQFIIVIMAGMLLGKRLGALACGFYVFLGLSGLPIFASGGGIGYFLQPTFGYLIGFIPTAWIVGYLCEKITQDNFRGYFIAGLAGVLVTYGCGLLYKYCLLNFFLNQPISPWVVLLSALSLQIPKDLLSCGVASLVVLKIKPLLTRQMGWLTDK